MYPFFYGCSVLALSLFSVNTWSQATPVEGPLSLGQALELTLHHSPDLSVYEWDTRIAETRRLQASLRPNPELSLEVEDLRFSTGPGSTTTSGNEREIEDGSSGGLGHAEYTLSLSQLVELGGKRLKRIHASEMDAEVFQHEYEIARADVLAEVAIIFIEVLGAQERVQLANDSLALAEDVSRAISAKVIAGQVSPIEETRATLQINQARIQVQHEEGALNSARYRLASMWGSPTPTFSTAMGTLAETRDILPLEQLKSLVAQSPDLRFWLIEINRREALVALERAQGKPDLGVTIGYRSQDLESSDSSLYDTSTNPSTLLGQSRSGFTKGRNESFIIGFSVPLPLFNRNQGAVQEAEYQVKKASATRRAKENRIHALLDSVNEVLRSAHKEVKSLREEVLPGAESAYTNTNKGYIAGKFSYLDVLDAQRTLVSARSQYLDSLIEYHQAGIQLERLAGIDISQPTASETHANQGLNQ